MKTRLESFKDRRIVSHMATKLSKEEKAELETLLANATEQRLALDQTLSEIESMVGVDLDSLDEWVGNGIDADALLEAAAEEQDND